MKTKILSAILLIITVGTIRKFVQMRNKYYRFMSIYQRKFQNYLDKNLIKDSYCNYFIVEFSEVKFWMIKAFFIDKKYKLRDLYDGNLVYKNFKASIIKDSGEVPTISNYNKIMNEWRKYR